MDKEEFIVDRIESDYIVVETSLDKTINLKKEDIRGTVKEGDILNLEEDKFIVNNEATKLRKEKINKMMKGIWAE